MSTRRLRSVATGARDACMKTGGIAGLGSGPFSRKCQTNRTIYERHMSV
ncbi:hypothetical protein MPL1032_10155 [Mesorhizobium plurifarium]|uniref:Uncharacterized protein n=1 Tax=Mesorhizobium plurifarium TaxID=69974 RepID=A0A0K2VMJ4_MESPL|nr:hypothetical protein MPL1032_10155 [Mesorhizobium plurifarium]